MGTTWGQPERIGNMAIDVRRVRQHDSAAPEAPEGGRLAAAGRELGDIGSHDATKGGSSVQQEVRAQNATATAFMSVRDLPEFRRRELDPAAALRARERAKKRFAEWKICAVRCLRPVWSHYDV